MVELKNLIEMNEKEINKKTIILSKECYEGKWCKRSYPNYKNGCINYGKSLCPPNSFYFKDIIDNYNNFYLIYFKFDFLQYKYLRKIIHPEWSEKQLGNSRHWQNSLKSMLMKHIVEILEFNNVKNIYILSCGSGISNKILNKYQNSIYSMESVGINVLSTLKLNKIKVERNPVNFIILTGLLASNEELKFKQDGMF